MFTGGCHYNLGCNLHEKQCVNCPLFKDKEIASSLYLKKLKAFEGLNIITLSKWMQSFVDSSEFRCKLHQIYNSVDTKNFFKINSIEVKKELQLSKKVSGKKLFL